ncbi:MAG: GNAT family N-acetyltransferase [[Actinobacillus] rossii]|nr:GNAT family N-acetyltransferase [[Actinobacillus] rossii]MDY5793116.1 GNAT family N-acetyltransferase [[Actinobacillus] rossii]
MLAERRLTLKYDQNPPHFPPHLRESAVILSPENFSKAKNLLGQEFDWILYDGRTTLNLDALAIAIGTLRAGGELVLWLDKNQQIDLDSLRWSGVEQGIETPNFNAYFDDLIEKYRRDTLRVSDSILVNASTDTRGVSLQATAEQSQIISKILKQQADLYIITAKRGRGKSALAGMLINRLASRCYVTAPNKSAVKTLQDFAAIPLNFVAPDELVAQIRQDPELFREDWLFIDEAAMLPLPLLFQLISTFKHIVITTTIHSYEGTGRGFLLKFLAKIDRSFQHFELTKPLRWAEGDKLEQFIDELLLLEAEDRLAQPEFNSQSAVGFRQVSQSDIVTRIQDFYGLLTLAHYRTSPLDLRRLFDAVKQQFYVAEMENALLGGVWLVEEGGFSDLPLIEQICRGQRRPKGNLVAQSLAFYYYFPQACELTSLRISRIAVQPHWQHHGLGQKLIEQVFANADVDFLSVSFGYTDELMTFWQKCGFVLVQIGEHCEASSGCYSAIALRGMSVRGKQFVRQVCTQFERDFALTAHPLAFQLASAKTDWTLNAQDMVILRNFAKFHRTFTSSLAAIRRLVAQSHAVDCPLLADYCMNLTIEPFKVGGKRAWLAACRQDVNILLEKYEEMKNA